MRTMIGIAAAAIGLALAPTTQAAAMLGGGGCASDLTLSSGSGLVNCYGRIDNNVLNNAHNTEINAALSSLGYSGPAISFNTIPQSNILDPLNGSTTIDFPGTLNGTVFFGVHFGNGQGGPGNTTTFYRLLASNLDTIGLNLNASSNAVLLAAIPAVPEPTTWVLMLAGLGWIGMALRRGRTAKLRVSYGS